MVTACTTFSIAGVMWPFSDLVRHAGHLDAFWWLEVSSSASMIVGIVVLCFGLKTGGHFRTDAQPDPQTQQLMKYGLLVLAVIMLSQLIFGLLGQNLSPSSKLVGDLVLLHSLPLVFAAAIWFLIWKPNDRVLI